MKIAKAIVNLVVNVAPGCSEKTLLAKKHQLNMDFDGDLLWVSRVGLNRPPAMIPISNIVAMFPPEVDIVEPQPALTKDKPVTVPDKPKKRGRPKKKKLA